MRRAVFGEPLLAHPAEIGGVHATWHPHPSDDDDRDQSDDDADDEQHMGRAAFSSAPNDPDTWQGDCLCACAQGIRHMNVAAILADVEGDSRSATGRAGVPRSHVPQRTCAFGNSAIQRRSLHLKHATWIDQSHHCDALGFNGVDRGDRREFVLIPELDRSRCRRRHPAARHDVAVE
jgi:hypothetical protein